ncbi:MAG: pyruvate dehydrogenase (acetyl-transferring) E1 component subunit alpha [Planctomycetota bacterium]|nr:MAG: pyruvate dehydrogenase (acetyl-transferring) E1 component subunit alpha [Planctomycetota bacterium]
MQAPQDRVGTGVAPGAGQTLAPGAGALQSSLRGEVVIAGGTEILRPPPVPPPVAELGPEVLRAMYRAMVLVRTLDTKMVVLQRQGRIAFYGPITGQEAATIGLAYAMRPEDWIFPALREAGVALVRGLELEAMVAQCFGNVRDIAKGRQMPCHYVHRAGNYYAMSSAIATQLPHAVGCAYASKLRREPVVSVACLGDGAVSEGDFHAAANFAGVWRVPCVFFCQNNQWAITVPYRLQSATATIAEKAVAYGFEGVRCDGNDVLAVYETARQAIEKARAGGGPTLVEALTYRILGHTTSDDPSRYRDEAEVAPWRERDPIRLFEERLREQGVLAAAEPEATAAWAKEQVEGAIRAVEGAPPPPLETLIEDVVAATPARLREQLAELRRAMARLGHDPLERSGH